MRIFVGRLRSNGRIYLFSREEFFWGSIKCEDCVTTSGRKTFSPFQVLARNVYAQFAQLGKLPEKVTRDDVVFSVAEEDKHTYLGFDVCEYSDFSESEQQEFWQEFRKLTIKAS